MSGRIALSPTTRHNRQLGSNNIPAKERIGSPSVVWKLLAPPAVPVDSQQQQPILVMLDDEERTSEQDHSSDGENSMIASFALDEDVKEQEVELDVDLLNASMSSVSSSDEEAEIQDNPEAEISLRLSPNVSQSTKKAAIRRILGVVEKPQEDAKDREIAFLRSSLRRADSQNHHNRYVQASISAELQKVQRQVKAFDISLHQANCALQQALLSRNEIAKELLLMQELLDLPMMPSPSPHQPDVAKQLLQHQPPAEEGNATKKGGNNKVVDQSKPLVVVATYADNTTWGFPLTPAPPLCPPPPAASLALSVPPSVFPPAYNRQQRVSRSEGNKPSAIVDTNSSVTARQTIAKNGVQRTLLPEDQQQQLEWEKENHHCSPPPLPPQYSSGSPLLNEEIKAEQATVLLRPAATIASISTTMTTATLAEAKDMHKKGLLQKLLVNKNLQQQQQQQQQEKKKKSTPQVVVVAGNELDAWLAADHTQL